MDPVSYLRSLMRPFLKGRLLEIWLHFKTAFFARKFARSVVATSKTACAEPKRAVSAKTEKLRRILFVCENMWERRELLPELVKISEVDFIDTRELTSNRARPGQPLSAEAVAEKLALLKERDYDLVMVYLRSELLSESLLQAFRERWHAPLIGLNLDDKTNFEHFEILQRSDRPYREWVKYFDCNLSNSRSMIEVYHANGFPCLYLPTGFHFDPRRTTTPQPKFQYLTTFVGSYKPERAKFIAELERLGIEVTVFGSGWRDAQFNNEGWKIYGQSQINLGLGYNVNGKQITNLKNRDFECPGAGGCYLTTFDWELAELFRVGDEILCYRDIYDLSEVWSFYMKRPDKCRAIAHAGQQRAVKEHTWEQRFRTVLGQLGFDVARR
ncbi:MAG: glycosyltransferase [Verrucomicrobia bacterium]|nr:glycosyltransferase [Verrucomicrobiota bacterium]